MIAIFDQSENKVVIIGDKLYRLSYEEFNGAKSLLESRGLVYLNTIESISNLKNVSSLSSNIESKISLSNQVSQTNNKLEKEYLVSRTGRCVVINGLEPKLQFMGLDDFKTLESIKNTYGKVPVEIQALVEKGTLAFVDEKEKKDRILEMQKKQSVKGKKVTQASSKSVRLAESSESNEDNFNDDSSEDFEDRVIKNAVKIDL